MNYINIFFFIIIFLLYNNISIIEILLCIFVDDKVFLSVLFFIKFLSYEFDSF